MAYGPHVMTPARRAALRKAQLASAAKRRKYGVGSQAKRAVRQFGQRTSAQAALYRHTGTKGHFAKTRKAVGYAAIAGAAGAGVAAAYGATAPRRNLNRNNKAFDAHLKSSGFSHNWKYGLASQAKGKVSSVRGAAIRNGAPAMKALPAGAFTPRAKYRYTNTPPRGGGASRFGTPSGLHDIGPIRRGRGGFRNSLKPGYYH